MAIHPDCIRQGTKNFICIQFSWKIKLEVSLLSLVFRKLQILRVVSWFFQGQIADENSWNEFLSHVVQIIIGTCIWELNTRLSSAMEKKYTLRFPAIWLAWHDVSRDSRSTHAISLVLLCCFWNAATRWSLNLRSLRFPAGTGEAHGAFNPATCLAVVQGPDRRTRTAGFILQAMDPQLTAEPWGSLPAISPHKPDQPTNSWPRDLIISN